MTLIPQTSDRFTMEWLRYYAAQYGSHNVSIAQDENGVMYIRVNDNEN